MQKIVLLVSGQIGVETSDPNVQIVKTVGGGAVGQAGDIDLKITDPKTGAKTTLSKLKGES